MSVRTDIRDRIILELNDAAPTGLPTATKRRFIAGEQLKDARMAVFFAKEEASLPQGPRGAITKRGMIFAIQAMSTVQAPDLADDAVEPMLTHIVEVLDKTNLGGLAHTVFEVGTDWAINTDSARVIVLALTLWRVEYQTRRGDMTLKQ